MIPVRIRVASCSKDACKRSCVLDFHKVIKIATKEKSFGSIKRFGVRYGRTVKDKLSKIEAVLKKKHKCPYCHSLSAKRLAAGIWCCKKCDAKFTGKAYSVSKKVVIRKKDEDEGFDVDSVSNKEKGEKYSENVKEDAGDVEESVVQGEE